MAAYGPKALKLVGEQADGFILQTADPDIARWTIGSVREAAAAAGRDPRRDHHLRGRARLRRRPTWRTSGTSCAGSAAWSATTSPTWSPATATSGAVPQALTDYIKGREGYDYAHHGKAGNPSTDFVPDEIVDRFCLLGPGGGARRPAAASWPRSASTSSRST